jgi:hypothetical protein
MGRITPPSARYAAPLMAKTKDYTLRQPPEQRAFPTSMESAVSCELSLPVSVILSMATGSQSGINLDDLSEDCFRYIEVCPAVSG